MPADLIGAHPALQKLKSSLPVLGARPTPLVIIGESGVGKSLVAAHVHQHSEHRHRAPDILNASTLDERDQRIRLFGGEPTILTTTRKSILENPTTVILKHVDHLRPHLQDELANALATQEVQRPGAETHRAILCRPIVTLREPPEKLLNKKRLSGSLYELLRSFKHISIPPLRKRGTDIQLLAVTFLKGLVQEYGRQSRTFTVRGLQENNKLDARLVSILTQNSWEGNVMQLKVFVRSLVVLPYDKLLSAEEHMQVTTMITNVAEGREFSLKASMDLVRQAIVSRAIEACEGNIRKAGQLLGITESSMHRRKATLLLIITYLSSDFCIADLLEMSLSFL